MKEQRSLCSHETGPNEWYNLANNPDFEEKKKELSAFLPKMEMPTVEDYVSTWSVVGADRERLRDQ